MQTIHQVYWSSSKANPKSFTSQKAAFLSKEKAPSHSPSNISEVIDKITKNPLQAFSANPHFHGTSLRAFIRKSLFVSQCGQSTSPAIWNVLTMQKSFEFHLIIKHWLSYSRVAPWGVTTSSVLHWDTCTAFISQLSRYGELQATNPLNTSTEFHVFHSSIVASLNTGM